LAAGLCLVACAHSKNLERTPQTDNCGLRGSTLELNISGRDKMFLALDIPEGVTLSEPVAVSCQERRTVIVTPEGVIRTLGSLDVVEGKEMLGFFPDGTFKAQNTIVFYTLDVIGRVSSASIAGENVVFRSVEGQSCRISTDFPSKPATCKK
jgi:hypothetical protein